MRRTSIVPAGLGWGGRRVWGGGNNLQLPAVGAGGARRAVRGPQPLGTPLGGGGARQQRHGPRHRTSPTPERPDGAGGRGRPPGAFPPRRRNLGCRVVVAGGPAPARMPSMAPPRPQQPKAAGLPGPAGRPLPALLAQLRREQPSPPRRWAPRACWRPRRVGAAPTRRPTPSPAHPSCGALTAPLPPRRATRRGGCQAGAAGAGGGLLPPLFSCFTAGRRRRRACTTHLLVAAALHALQTVAVS